MSPMIIILQRRKTKKRGVKNKVVMLGKERWLVRIVIVEKNAITKSMNVNHHGSGLENARK